MLIRNSYITDDFLFVYLFLKILKKKLVFQEPLTPYPTLVCVDDLMHIYVDFHPILSASSPDDAVALLIAMYSIFELSFDKKSRTTRLLYAVLYGDKQFLSNSIRILIKEKNIYIHCQRLQLPSSSSTSLSDIQPQSKNIFFKLGASSFAASRT